MYHTNIISFYESHGDETRMTIDGITYSVKFSLDDVVNALLVLDPDSKLDYIKERITVYASWGEGCILQESEGNLR